MIDELVDRDLRDELIEELCRYGPRGLPDIVGFKGGVLYFVEVKGISENVSLEQVRWLNWLGDFKGSGCSLVIRVTSRRPSGSCGY